MIKAQIEIPEDLAEALNNQSKITNKSPMLHVISAIEKELGFESANPLLSFALGRITKTAAIEQSGLRDYAELLIEMGRYGLSSPTLPESDIQEQVKVFQQIWNVK